MLLLVLFSILKWNASPVNDMYADAVLNVVLQAELSDTQPQGFIAPIKPDRMHFKECLIEMLIDMFGEDAVSKVVRGEKATVTVDGKKAIINIMTLEVKCEDDEQLQQIVQTAVTKLHQSLYPIVIR